MSKNSQLQSDLRKCMKKRRRALIQLIIDVILVFVLYVIVAVIWTIAEKMMYGHATARLIDDVVALILAISIYMNIK